MTKKDYVMLAKIIRNNTFTIQAQGAILDPINVINRNGLLTDLCCTLEHDNPNFDRIRFIEACND